MKPGRLAPTVVHGETIDECFAIHAQLVNCTCVHQEVKGGVESAEYSDEWEPGVSDPLVSLTAAGHCSGRTCCRSQPTGVV